MLQFSNADATDELLPQTVAGQPEQSTTAGVVVSVPRTCGLGDSARVIKRTFRRMTEARARGQQLTRMPAARRSMWSSIRGWLNWALSVTAGPRQSLARTGSSDGSAYPITTAFRYSVVYSMPSAAVIGAWAPTSGTAGHQRYADDSNVLVTTWQSADGELELTDAMLRPMLGGHRATRASDIAATASLQTWFRYLRNGADAA